MLKGAQKRSIVVKTPDSSIFDEAIFLVQPNYNGEELDMLAEADRIAMGVMGDGKRDKRRGRGSMWIYGLCGGAVGAFASALIFALINLIAQS